MDIDVVVENVEACPRYCAVTVKGVEVKESPEWLQTKLRTIGLRPINNIVDITNYIMMAYGQPLHCFDADMIKGGRVVVKSMPEGTPFVTLDGVEHKLSDRDLAICNIEEPMCIAGVFGGKGSGTYETTKDVLFESAYFNPTWIRKSARRHGLSTDASFRFERGIDPHGQIYALKQAALLAKELGGGTISMEIKDVNSAPISDFNVKLEYNYVDNLIGKHLPAETIKSIVTSLEMRIISETAEGLNLLVPAYRVDVQRPCDVVEDILRIYGYNNVDIPKVLKANITVKSDVDKSNKLENLVAEQLVGAGFNEILNNSLTKAAYYDDLASYPSSNLVRLMNPLSTDLNVLRQTLLFGGLESISHNSNRKNADVRFFEYGNCYHYDKSRKCPDIIPGVSKSTEPEVIKHVLDAYSEELHLGLWITGKRVKGSWAHADEDSSIFELKSHLLNIFARLGLNLGTTVIVDSCNDLFSKAVEIQTRGGKILAIYGVISKKIAKKLDIDNDVYFGDIYWKNVMKAIKNNKVTYREFAKYPAVSRDLALLIDRNVEFESIRQIAYGCEKKFLKDVNLFDVYEGKNLEVGKKSYAVNFILQDENKTMNDKQVDAIMNKIIQSLEKQLGAKLR